MAPDACAQRLKRISEAEFSHYPRWLRLDDDQETIARSFYDQYIESWEKDFWSRIQTYNSTIGSPIEPGHHEAVRKNRPNVEAMQQERVDRDEALFANLESILRKDQLSYMRRVRLGRQRDLWDAGRGTLPEGNVDLVALLGTLELNTDERTRVDAFLVEFEPRFVSLLKHWREGSAASYEYYHQYSPMERKLQEDKSSGRIDPAEYAEIRQTTQRLRIRGGRLTTPRARNLVQANRAALAALHLILAEENYVALNEQYLLEAYPKVYPDPAFAQQLFEVARSLDDLTDEQRTVIEILELQFHPKHERLTEDMAESTFKRREGSMIDSPEGQETMYLEWKTLFEIGAEREALNQKQAALLKRILMPEQFARLPEWDFEKNPRPRPWDTGYERRRLDKRYQERRQRESNERKGDGGR